MCIIVIYTHARKFIDFKSLRVIGLRGEPFTATLIRSSIVYNKNTYHHFMQCSVAKMASVEKDKFSQSIDGLQSHLPIFVQYFAM